MIHKKCAKLHIKVRNINLFFIVTSALTLDQEVNFSEIKVLKLHFRFVLLGYNKFAKSFVKFCYCDIEEINNYFLCPLYFIQNMFVNINNKTASCFN